MSNEVQVKQSPLTLERMFFDECTFVRRSESVSLDVGLHYDYNFTRNITKIDNEHYKVSLRCNVTEEESAAIEVHVRVIGEFSINATDLKTKKTLINQNAVAILFPFVRCQAAIMTAQIGCPSIVLPVVNVAEMFEDVDLPGESRKN